MANIDSTRRAYHLQSQSSANAHDKQTQDTLAPQPTTPRSSGVKQQVNVIMSLIKQLMTTTPNAKTPHNPLLSRSPHDNNYSRDNTEHSPSDSEAQNESQNDFLVGDKQNNNRLYKANDLLQSTSNNDGFASRQHKTALPPAHEDFGFINNLDKDNIIMGKKANDLLFSDYNNSSDLLRGGYDNEVVADKQGHDNIKGGYSKDLLRLSKPVDRYYINFANNIFELKNKQSGHTNTVTDVELFDFSGQFYTYDELLERSHLLQENKYHSFDGGLNNLDRPNLGKTGSIIRSLLPKDPSRELGTASEANLPNPRAISNAVSAQSELTSNKKGLSDLFWVWGQFLDHDISLTPTNSDDTAAIAIPEGDAYFDPQGTGSQTIPFNRSVMASVNDNTNTLNALTAYIDGSNIYGSDKATADSLRDFKGGRLTLEANNLLPLDEDQMFIAGDVRTNENIGLTAMNILWVREHNQVANNLAEQNPQWNDEKLYQEARKQVIATIQAITYNEFLPQLLGNNTLSPYQGYDSSLSTQLSDGFVSAAYCLNHTMLSPSILRLDEDGNEIQAGNLALRDALFRPDHISDAGIEPILRGLSSQTAQAMDAMVIDDVRNFLFDQPGNGGFDLAALNIQRGRDHAMPSYNAARQALGLEPITQFDDSTFQDDFGQRLASVYNSPDDIDLWVGGLAETPMGDALTGPTFTTILKEQFEHLRNGDRFWYEDNFAPHEIDQLKQARLADVIRRNTNIQSIQNDALVASNVHLHNVSASTADSANTETLKQPTLTAVNPSNVSRLLDPMPVNALIAEVLVDDAKRAGSQQ